MSVKVKICGLSEVRTLDAALDARADMIGLVFFPRSARNVSLDAAAALAERARGRAKVVAVTVDPDDALIADLKTKVRPDLIQLHGSETPRRAETVRLLSGAGVIKAIKVASADDVASASAYEGVADLILYDAAPPTDAGLPGGNARAFDWRLLSGVRHGYVLSGGLDTGNVAEAMAQLHPYAVDVSSGVERAPGVKDEALIGRFIAAAKQELAPAS